MHDERTAKFSTRRYGDIDPKRLEQLLGINESPKVKKRPGFLRPDEISVLSQWRKSFRDIPSLANSIAQRQLINPLIIAVFTRAECERYIEAVNILWETTHHIDQLAATMLYGQQRYCVLIAGERRLHAFFHLWNVGCDACRETYGDEPAGTCFHRHAPNGIEVSFRRGLNPHRAFTLQYEENSYQAPDYDEQATGYKLYYELLRVAEPEMSLAQFAKTVNRNPSTLGRMLKYCDLSPNVRNLVRDGSMDYSVALLFAQYAVLMTDERELTYWVRVATEERPSVENLRKRMKTELQVRKGQTTMFGHQQLIDMQERHRKRMLDTTIAGFIARFEGFLAHALRRYRDGALGEANSPFGEGSIVSAVLGIYALLTLLVPHMNRAMTAKERARMHGARELLDPEIEKLEQHTERHI